MDFLIVVGIGYLFSGAPLCVCVCVGFLDDLLFLPVFLWLFAIRCHEDST